jgi:cytochrome c553
MAKSIRDYTKKNRAAQAGTMVGVRLQPEQLARLDAWIASLSDPKPTRPEAIRRALEAVIRLGGLDPEDG